MDSTAGRDRDAAPPAPFLLKLFYRTGAFHRPDEFASGLPHNLPPHVNIYTWPSCTLSELSHQLADSMPDLLPSPSIGTRLAFRLIYADARGGSGGGGGPQHHRGLPARFIVKDLGSVVIGDGGPGIYVGGSAENNEGGDDVDYTGASAVVGSEAESAKTLGDAKFVVGDYISCAILPPSASGAVAPASSARTGRGAGLGESRTAMGGPPPRRENGFGGGGRGGRGGGGSRGGYGGGAGGFGGRDPAGSMPMGDWRRGERLPDAPPGRDRDRGRGRGRW